MSCSEAGTPRPGGHGGPPLRYGYVRRFADCHARRFPASGRGLARALMDGVPYEGFRLPC